MLPNNRLIACVAARCSVDIPHFNGILFHACHTINYTTCVYYMLRVNMVHANTHRYLVCSCHVTMRGILRTCEVIIELYCMINQQLFMFIHVNSQYVINGLHYVHCIIFYVHVVCFSSCDAIASYMYV